MYLAGLTAREIADRVHRGVSTVHYHLRRRDYYDPGFQAKHEVALAARGKKRPSTTWRRRAKEVTAFQDEYGRLPSSKGDAAEHLLYVWIAEQRKQHDAGRLPLTKLTLLQNLNGWMLDPRQSELDDVWRNKLSAVCRFFEEQGRFPRYRTYQSDQERSLGVWLHNQHQRRNKKLLLPWRLEALNDSLPGWRSRA